MANQVQIFENEQFGKVRIIEEDGKVLFCGTDVAVALGYTNPRKAVRDHTPHGTKRSIRVQTGKKADGTPAVQMVETLFIPEGDVYRLITRSKLPAAQKFESWVFDEVLPSIRRHGLYATDEVLKQMIVSPELVKGMAEQLIAERAKVKEQATTIAVQGKSIERMKPKEDYCDKVLSSPNAVPITIIAKDYGFSAQAMNELLYVLGVQYKRGQTWVLKQEYARAGYTKSYTYLAPSGESVVQTRWTQKGRLFIYELLKKERGILPLDGKAA